MSIFDELADRHPTVAADLAGPITEPIPLVRPGENDDLVERTWNGLRPDDLALPQPPQDPEWRPDGHR